MADNSKTTPDEPKNSAGKTTQPAEKAKPDIKVDPKSGSFVWHAPADYKPKPKPTEPLKEVKPVAEETFKDPTGQFNYEGCKQVVVQDGESLLDIANKNNVALQQLRYFNHVDKSTLKVTPKQKLAIPQKPIQVPTGK